MRLYDSVIADTKEQLSMLTPRAWAYDESRAWPDAGVSELVLMRDAAYELGGSGSRCKFYLCDNRGYSDGKSGGSVRPGS